MADSWTQVDPQRPQRLECSSGGVTHRVITEKDSRLSSHRDDRGGMGEMMAAMLAWMAEQERKMIVRRVKAGLAARKAKGLRLGRTYSLADEDGEPCAPSTSGGAVLRRHRQEAEDQQGQRVQRL